MFETKLKVCIWGDSIFKGVIYSPDLNRHIFINDSCINLIANEYKLQIENYSKFGQTSAYALDKLPKALALNHDFNYAIIELGGNDCDYNWKDISTDPDANHLAKVSLEDYIHNIESIVLEFKKYSITPIIVNLPPIDAERYFRFISTGLNSDNIHKWLKDVEHIYRVQEMYSLALTKYAYRNGIKVLDLRGDLLAEENYYQYVCEDGIHINERGHHKIYELFVKYIANSINSDSNNVV